MDLHYCGSFDIKSILKISVVLWVRLLMNLGKNKTCT